MKKILFSICIVSLMCACGKKSTTPSNSLTTLQKLQNNWNLINISDIQYVGSSTTVIDTIINYGLSGDYVNFNSNGKAYYRIAGSYDTVNYNLINDTQILFDGDTFTVNSLTTTDMVMTYYGRETSPVNNWDNVLVLKR
ncbi:MAG: hypothetical protein IPI46_10110 [Bacteroidetes bacterium]|nr:hypothetical protein [Bacteroidota bacterium]